MLCGFINRDYTMEYKELDKNNIEKLCLDNKYFSINLDSEYYIFIENEIYTVENIDKVMLLVTEINKELFSNMIKNNKK